MSDKTNYAANVVAAKLYGIVDSPVEMVLGTALFERFSTLYQSWWCRVYSDSEYRKSLNEKTLNEGSLIAIVPQFNINAVGRVDFAIFLPRLQPGSPLVVIECDGHEFHERTPEQASKDKRRDRSLTAMGIPVFRFTGADILRDAKNVAYEVADLFDRQSTFIEERWWVEIGNEANINNPQEGCFIVPYQWPRMRTDGKRNKPE
jgi:very-short-patch-repair endonuclease